MSHEPLWSKILGIIFVGLLIGTIPAAIGIGGYLIIDHRSKLLCHIDVFREDPELYPLPLLEEDMNEILVGKVFIEKQYIETNGLLTVIVEYCDYSG